MKFFISILLLVALNSLAFRDGTYARSVKDNQEKNLDHLETNKLDKKKLKREETLILKKKVFRELSDDVKEIKMTTKPDEKMVMYFDSGIAESKDLVNIATEILRLGKENEIAKVHVVGHTDNNGLSAFRGRFTANSLSSSGGIKIPISYEGRGFSDPIASNDTPEGRAKNRRTEIFIYYKKSKKVAEEVTKEIKSKKYLLKEISCPKESKQSKKPFKISFDGVGQDGAQESSADEQRCIDVALEKAKIQVHLNRIDMKKSLNLRVSQRRANSGEKVNFYFFSNYSSRIEKAQLRFFRKGQSSRNKPLEVIEIKKEDLDLLGIQWVIPTFSKNNIFPLEQTYSAVLRVYDEKGRFDESQSKDIIVSPSIGKGSDRVASVSYLDQKDFKIDTQSNSHSYDTNAEQVSIDAIPVNGSSIIVNGEGIPESHKVYVMGQTLKVDKNGKFATEQILSAGKKYDIEIAIVDQKEKGIVYNREIHIPKNNWFFVGLADLTAGQNQVAGPAQILNQELDQFEKEIFIDGRLAFYLRGKIKGEYLIKASMDTRETSLSQMFNQFLDKDPNQLFRRLDPNEYYPVYGDDSSLIEDAPTQGKLFVKIQKGDSYFLWGNFKAKNYQTELARIDRGLYGANLHLESKGQVENGEKKTELDAFASEPGTVNSRNEFRGGQSFYVLRNRDIVPGSEQIRVEVRDQFSGLVLQNHSLVYGEDYSVNYILGNITLREPLPSIADQSSLVRAGAFVGNPVFLTVSYEYVPGFTKVDSLVLGGRAKQWLGDNIRVGATLSQNDMPGNKHSLQAGDLLLDFGGSNYVKAEVAQSKGVGASEMSSIDGGYFFTPIDQATIGPDTEAQAYFAESSFNLYSIESKQANVKGYYKKKDAGFSAVGELARFDTIQTGADINLPLSQRIDLYGSYVKKDEKNWVNTEVINIDLKTYLGDYVRLEGGVSRNLKEDHSTGGVAAVSTIDNFGKRDDALGLLGYRFDDNLDIYGFFQKTLETTGGRLDNDRYGAGTSFKINNSLDGDLEISDGDLGLAAKAGVTKHIDENTEIYTNYLLENSRTDTSTRVNLGERGKLIGGTKKRFNDSSDIFYESRFEHGRNNSTGLTHAFGLNHSFKENWNFGFTGEFGKIRSSDRTTETDRKAGSIGLGYSNKKMKWASSFEIRKEESFPSTQKRTTWLSKNTFGGKISESWRFLSRLNISKSKSSTSDFFNGDYLDGIAGLAYRPVTNDRFNLLTKYRYYEFLPSPGQVDSNGNIQSFRQRSHIISADTIIDLNRCGQERFGCFELGLKYAFAKREIQNSRLGTGPWFSSDKHLGIANLTYHTDYRWDLLAEYRYLYLNLSQDARKGALGAIYYNFGNKNTVKLGAGYNFTDYSTDLTNDDFNYHGWFVNLVGGF